MKTKATAAGTKTKAKSAPPLNALDFVRVAVMLDPARCRSNPLSVFRDVLALYQMAALFVELNAGRSFTDMYLDSEEIVLGVGGDNLMQIALDYIQSIRGKASLEEAERNKLRLYPSHQTDAVRGFFCVKTERAVKGKIKRWFLACGGADDASALRKFEIFWTEAQRTDSEGKKYVAITAHLLNMVATFETEVRRKGGIKAIQHAEPK